MITDQQQIIYESGAKTLQSLFNATKGRTHGYIIIQADERFKSLMRGHTNLLIPAMNDPEEFKATFMIGVQEKQKAMGKNLSWLARSEVDVAAIELKKALHNTITSNFGPWSL